MAKIEIRGIEVSIEKRFLCPYCGSERSEEYNSCCGENHCDYQDCYVDNDGNIVEVRDEN